MTIDPTARISSGAKIAPDVKVGAYSVIGDEVEIGANCEIYSHVVITGPCKIGGNNRIFQFSSIGADPQDLKFKGEKTWLQIGSNNTFRECTTINRGTGSGGGITRIGNANLFMAYVHIAHDCIIGNGNIFANNTSLAGHVVVRDFANFGGFTTILQFVEIGSFCFSHTGTFINRNIPPFVAISGSPAKPAGINQVGLSRKGFDEEQLAVIKKLYKLFFRSEARLPDRVAIVEASAEGFEFAQEFVDFVKEKGGNKSGLIR